VALLDARGVIVKVNEAWRQFAKANGLRWPSFGVGENYLKICEHAVDGDSAVANDVAAAIREALVGKQPEGELEYPCHSAKRLQWFRIQISPVEIDGAPGALVMHIDITGRKTSELRLRTQDQQYQILLNSTSEGVYALDRNGICTFCNLAAAQLLGYKRPSDMVGLAFHQRHHHSSTDGRPTPWESCKIHLASQTAASAHVDDEVFFRRDGTSFPVEYFAQPVLHGSEVVGTVVAFRDITERQLLEAQFLQVQKLESVARLTGGIAHDFKNALSVIAGYGQLIEERVATDEKARKYAHQISLAAQRAASVTRQLLVLNRRSSPERVLLNLTHLVTSMQEMLGRILGENIALTTALEAELPPIDADPGQIEQVLMNLVVNARDAMPEGGKLVIRTSNGGASSPSAWYPPRTAAFVALEVSDNGCGIDNAIQDRIFEPFFTTKDSRTGTGLGLTAVYDIVKQSGGSIHVQSEPGLGTSFTILFPVAKSEPELMQLPPPRQGIVQGSETILVIEDEEALRSLIADALRENGYVVLEAQNGRNGIEIAENNRERIALMLVDLMLPDLNGVRVAEKVRASNQSSHVLYMSAYTDKYAAELSVLNPETTFLEKPFDLGLMLLAVRDTLDRKRADLRPVG
jgi:PAS domain S-box-containing protein